MTHSGNETLRSSLVLLSWSITLLSDNFQDSIDFLENIGQARFLELQLTRAVLRLRLARVDLGRGLPRLTALSKVNGAREVDFGSKFSYDLVDN